MTGDYSNKIGNIFGYTHRVSWAKKKANNFRWVEEMGDYYDFYHGENEKSKRLNDILMNYDLYNGRGSMKKYNSDPVFFWNIGDEGDYMDVSHLNVQHHDIISRAAKAMVGEQRKRPLSPMAIDISRYTTNMRKQKRLELIQQYIQETIIAPMQQQALQMVMQEQGIDDPFSLAPEQQQQIQQMAQERMQAMAPKEIEEYMRKDYKSPAETQAQKLLDYLMKELKIKETTDEGFKHGLISGTEVYRVYLEHGRPKLELVNPVGFTWSGAQNVMFIEEGEWAKYEQTIKYTDVFNKWGDILTPKDIKKLDSLFLTGTGASSQYRSTEIDSKLVSVVSSNPEEEMKAQAVDVRTREGQEYLNDLHRRASTQVDPRSTIRHVHIVFKSLRKLRNIKRIDFNTGNVRRFWVDENYTFNPGKGDIEEKVAWVPEVWEVDKIGYTDAIYINKRRVPGQYRSLNNPYDIKLPYVGIEYNRLMSNSRNTSIMDLGKPWQFKFNVEMARLHEMEATDIGKILISTMGAKPKNWSWKQFYETIRYGKMAILDITQDGSSPVDAQLFKGVDLGNSQGIMEKIQYLEFLKNMIPEAMGYNMSRLGEISPYTAVRNNQQNIMQSSHQTEDIFTTHNIVVENLLNVLINTAREGFKEEPEVLSYILDDMSRAELEIDWEMLHRSELGVYIRNSGEDFQNIDLLKQNLQAMLQNGLISFSEFAKVLYAKNGAEILNIAEQAEQRLERMKQQDAEIQQQSAAQQAQMQEQLLRLKTELELMKELAVQEPKLQVDRERNILQAQQYANQYDINKNNQNDQIEQQREQQEFEAKEKEKERKHESKENEKDRALEKFKALRSKSSS